MGFWMGFLGALSCGGVFAGGFLAGWRAKTAFFRREQRHVTARRLSEEERRRLREQREAFQELQNYSVETAYGMTGGQR